MWTFTLYREGRGGWSGTHGESWLDEAGKAETRGESVKRGGGNSTLLCNSLSKTLIHNISPVHLHRSQKIFKYRLIKPSGALMHGRGRRHIGVLIDDSIAAQYWRLVQTSILCFDRRLPSKPHRRLGKVSCCVFSGSLSQIPTVIDMWSFFVYFHWSG